MASSMSIGDDVSCGVCMEHYNRTDHIPKILPCQHTFCLACLLALESSSFSMSTECPICRSQHQCSPRDFTTNRAVMDIAEKLQQQASQSLSCSTHADKHSVVVCVDCLAGICAKCVMTQNTHRDHRVEDLNDAKTLLRERFVEETRKQQFVLQTEMASASSVKEITRAEDDVKELCTLLISVITKWQNDQLSIIGDIKAKAAKREQEMNEQHAKLEAMLQNDIYISTLITNLRRKDKISCPALQGNTYNFVTARQTMLADLTSMITSENWVKAPSNQLTTYVPGLLGSQKFRAQDQPAEPEQKPDPDAAPDKEDCPICQEPIEDLKCLDKCGHKFCKNCIKQSFEHKPLCPICGVLYGKTTGNQPTNGKMRHHVRHNQSLPGYSGCGTIDIEYEFPGGIQGEEHPNPGERYSGTGRSAYLPDNHEGRKVLGLLKEAFKARLVFTISRSVTSGMEYTVTCNDIHHKTNTHGGPERYGYPDPTYLSRVTQELAAKGITF